MANEEIIFQEEDCVIGYLGVHIDQRKDNFMHFIQKGLLNRIIDVLHLNNETVSAVGTPCTKYLAIDDIGELAHGNFKYCSIVSQLNYL